MMEFKPSESGTDLGPWRNVWRIINTIMALFFILAAAVNLNDHDWYVWVPMYLTPAVLACPVIINPSFSENKIWGNLHVIYLTICLAQFVYQIVLAVEASKRRPGNPLQNEEGRELGGLLIIIAWVSMCRFTSLGRPHSSSSNRSLINAFLLMSITLAVLPLFTWGLCYVADWHTKLGHCKDMFL